MVDGAFFVKRSRHVWGRLRPERAADLLHRMALDHLRENGVRISTLHRIFVYDAPPVSWRGHTLIGRIAVDLGKSAEADWRRRFHARLLRKRKVALRLGEIPTSLVRWQLAPRVLRDLLAGRRTWSSLTDEDFRLDLRQKGVDMRLGIAVASLALKRLVGRIVLVTGDSDFVPAAKLARREGIEVALDPMWAEVRDDLLEHVDGLRNTCPHPGGGRGARDSRGDGSSPEAEARTG